MVIQQLDYLIGNADRASGSEKMREALVTALFEIESEGIRVRKALLADLEKVGHRLIDEGRDDPRTRSMFCASVRALRAAVSGR